jgi:hypothetical protein
MVLPYAKTTLLKALDFSMTFLVFQTTRGFLGNFVI